MKVDGALDAEYTTPMTRARNNNNNNETMRSYGMKVISINCVSMVVIRIIEPKKSRRTNYTRRTLTIIILLYDSKIYYIGGRYESRRRYYYYIYILGIE